MFETFLLVCAFYSSWGNITIQNNSVNLDVHQIETIPVEPTVSQYKTLDELLKNYRQGCYGYRVTLDKVEKLTITPVWKSRKTVVEEKYLEKYEVTK